MLLFIVLLSILFLLYLWIKPRLSPLSSLPEPKPWHFLGHTPHYLLSGDHIGLQLSWADQFKDKGLFKTRSLFDGQECVHIIKTEWAKFIWQRPDMFRRTDALRTFFPLLRHGLLVAMGDEHRFQKKILSKAFSRKPLGNYIPIFERHANQWCQILSSKVAGNKDGANLDIREFMNNFSFNVLGEIAFGCHFNSDTSKPDPFLEIMREQCSTLLNVHLKMLVGLFPFLLKIPGVKEKYTGENAKEALDHILLRRKRRFEENSLTEFEKRDLLSIMMSEKDETTGKMFTDMEIRDNCFTFMLAGHETIGTTIPIVLYHMAKFPQMQEKMREEVNQRFSIDSISLSSEDLNLPYTDAFIKESLRYFPTATSSRRVSEVDCYFGDFKIPKGTFIVINSCYLNRDPNEFDYPDEFIPERFFKKSNIKCGTTLSFGYGPFNCIGKRFALLEMKSMLIRLLQHFRFSIDDEFNDRFTERKEHFAVRTKPPIIIRFHQL